MLSSRDSFGVLAFLHWNHDWNNFHFREDVLPQALDQLRDLGAGFIRMDIIWSDIHRGLHQYDFTRYDKLVSEVCRRGLKILAVLQYNKEGFADGKVTWNNPPESFEEFSAYVGATVARYKEQIHHWEIWNEPNLPVYWSGPKDDLAAYVKMLTLSYQAAKKADPACLVMNGGLTEPLVQDVGHFYAQGGGKSTDVLNLHTFLDPHDPQSEQRFARIFEGVEGIMGKNGDAAKKIWITEMGCPGVPSDKMNLNWFGGKAVDEKTQADWVEKQARMVEKYPRIEKLFWAFYRDTENEFKDAADYLGLVRLDLSPKPAFDRLKGIISRYPRNS